MLYYYIIINEKYNFFILFFTALTLITRILNFSFYKYFSFIYLCISLLAKSSLSHCTSLKLLKDT